jgi:hypothetical protein
MKRKIVSALAVFLILHAVGHTQLSKPMALVKTGNEWKMSPDVYQRAKT